MHNIKIGIIGLGYVGLPLAHLFALKYPVVGFDIDQKRILELQLGVDSTLEIAEEELKKVTKGTSKMEMGLFCTHDSAQLKDCNYFIVTVPTPVDRNNYPDLTPLLKSAETVGRVLKKDDIVIFESTVYPGVTEDECVPVLEKTSGLKFNRDFFVGYSPERINPGDKTRSVENILKVTSGSTPEIGKKVDALYSSIIKAGTYLAPSIKVAEASKVVENSQRDINIAFVNELAKIFNLLNIDTQEVLKVAGTKWNFLPFKPGLVGGHCIGVDPYYLSQKAQEFGYHPGIILEGRRMNEGMGRYVSSQVVNLMVQNDIKVKGAEVLILGVTFKENCPDVRNTKVVDVITSLESFGANITIYDPWASPSEVIDEYQLEITNDLPSSKFDAIILTVAHKEFTELDIRAMLTKGGVLYDVKGVLTCRVEGRL